MFVDPDGFGAISYLRLPIVMIFSGEIPRRIIAFLSFFVCMESREKQLNIGLKKNGNLRYEVKDFFDMRPLTSRVGIFRCCRDHNQQGQKSVSTRMNRSG